MFNTFGQVEKRKVFNRTFWLGLVFGSGLFALINIGSYLIENARYKGYLEKRITFAPASRFDFGFPWFWDGSGGLDGVLNLVVCTLFGFAFGLGARYLYLLPKIGPMK
jgi:membrane protease YdiL (CAAX protease family)